MSSYKKPEKIASDIKEVDDEKTNNNKAPQGLIRDTKITETKNDSNHNNNDEGFAATKGIKFKF